MAITGPSELGHVLKVDSDPMKKYVLSKLGHPVVEVEVAEDQWETVLKTTGDFIAHYFSKEQKFGVFYTQPLKSTYDLPEDAYWVQEVAWDPVTTMIDQIFGAESFLFCFGSGFMILRDDGRLVDVKNWQSEYKCKTPYGDKTAIIEKQTSQQLVTIDYTGGQLLCTPNHPVKTNSAIGIDDWVAAGELKAGDKLVGPHMLVEVLDVSFGDGGETHSIHVPSAHCFYGCCDGLPILVY